MNKMTAALLMFLFTIPGFTQEHTKVYKIHYMVEPQDTLAKIYMRFVYPNSIITKNTPMNQMTFKRNPQVEDWNKLTTGTEIDLYIAYEYLDMNKYQAYLDKLKADLERIKALNETENSAPGFTPQGLKASLFYMASYGKFTQKDPERAEVDFYQNSPITLGASFSYYPKDSNWSYASSGYVSYLMASANNLDDSNVSVAPELGVTLYPEYRFNQYNFTGYFGLDFERFSTFNMGGIQEDRKIILDENTVLYATVGFSKLVHVFGSPFFTKFSFSHSLSSQISTNPDGIDEGGNYTGYKFLWYVNKKFNDKIYLHTLFKYHTMDGPSELQTLRLGVGLGYILY
ncbi:MAG: hypothetical protein NDI69_14060 [Bacteriovoracaceae bacterium]|nr:hypothetical protein [Bacteriovoracaceae bacterium]